MARAERLRTWAEGREAKAETAYENARQIADMIPFGQPILAGHHSQRRAERDQERIGSAMDRSVEHSSKARSMRSRADNIETAAASAIYSDDPDAVGRLQSKLEALEAARARIVAYNRSARAAAPTGAPHGDLSLLAEDQKRQLLGFAEVMPQLVKPGLPFPSYGTSNLSGQISSVRKRLAQASAGFPVQNP